MKLIEKEVKKVPRINFTYLKFFAVVSFTYIALKVAPWWAG